MASSRDRFRRLVRHENAVLALILIALVAVIGAITRGLTTSRVNITNVLLQSSITGISAVGQTFVVLSGGIDLSVAGVGLFCATLGSSLMTLDPVTRIISNPYPIYTTIPIMLITGVSWGVINGSAVSRLSMPPLIVTLSIWRISEGAAFQICRGSTIMPLPENMAFLGQGTVAGVPMPVIVFIIVCVVAYFVLYYTTFGRCVYATGSSPVVAWLTGINVKNVHLTVYAISGLLAGLAAVIMTSRIMSCSMQTLSGLELDTLAAVFIGGISMSGGNGNLIGVIIGVIIIGVINNVISVLGATAALKAIILGSLIIAAVAIDYLRRSARGYQV